ncbi:MAG: endo-1,4-beta-xylanase, partial [Lachnospiraceae bacterium]|nr:endo-1,4-beta-xylanase [Lachnospiraceae bacterium]
MKQTSKKMWVQVVGLLCLTAFFCAGCKAQEEVSVPGQESQESVSVEDQEASKESETAKIPEVQKTEADSKEPEIESLKEYCKDYFKLGVGINGSTLDNLTLNNEKYMEMVKQHFNSVTLSNLMKSCYILKQDASIESAKKGDGSPVLTYESIDPTLQWCMDNGVGMRGHTLVWHTQAPDWFFKEGYKNDGAYVDKETMLFRMESYIKQLMTHVQDNYPGVVYCWDVVNEAVDPVKGDPASAFHCRTELDGTPNPWYVTIGEEYVEMAFTYARKYAAEGVKLFYNDFNTYETEKREYIYTLCDSLKEKGLIDGIGMQGYYGTSYPSQSAIAGTVIRFSQLGLELQLTEFSVSV